MNLPVIKYLNGEPWFPYPNPPDGNYVLVAVGEGTVTAETGWWCVVRRAFDNCEAHPDRRFLFPDRRIDGHETCGEAVVVRTEQP